MNHYNRLGHRKISLIILIFFFGILFSNSIVTAYGALCSTPSYANQPMCDRTGCCHWDVLQLKCLPYAAGTLGDQTHTDNTKCTGQTYCQGSTVANSTCDGVNMDCGQTLQTCVAPQGCYFGTCQTTFCGNKIVEPGEECDNGQAAQDFMDATVVDNATGTKYPMCAGLGGANIFCQDKGYNKASGDGPSNAIASNVCVYPATIGSTGANFIFVTGSKSYGGKWYKGTATTNTLPPIHCMFYSATLVNGYRCTPTAYGVPCIYCSDTCSNATFMQYCGDNIITNPPEECDDGNNVSGDGCSSSCKIEIVQPVNTCGNGVCQSSESLTSCFVDCDITVGWDTGDLGWNMTTQGYLIVNGLGGLIKGPPIDLKAGTDYTLSAIVESSGLQVRIYVDGQCTPSSNIETSCFQSPDNQMINVFNAGPSLPSLSTITVNIPNNPTYSVNGVFKNVRIYILANTLSQSGASPYAIIHNISFKESTGVQYVNAPTSGQQASSCCPSTYCWNGSACVTSDTWMNDPKATPYLGNTLSSIATGDHVDSIYQSQATGYRCLINSTTGEAGWVLSQVKYDWNYFESGYCGKTTDCYGGTTVTDTFANTSANCVPDGQVVQGNHYCHGGNWTTKSYIVATLLQNISVENNHNYILQCYNESRLNYNNDQQFAGIIASCVMIMQIPPDTEQVITGVILDNTSYPYTSKFILDLFNLYINYRTTSLTTQTPIYNCLSAVPSGTNNFSLCFSDTNIFVYYETNYKYFLISDRDIPGITAPTFWDRIAKFFKDLFGARRVNNIQEYDVLNYTTNYDNIYIVRNNSVDVTAVEEAKYDEQNRSIVNILYVNYTGSNEDNNPIDRDTLFKRVNDTQTGVPVLMNYTNTSNQQEVILRTQTRSGIWQYLTTILRVRP